MTSCGDFKLGQQIFQLYPVGSRLDCCVKIDCWTQNGFFSTKSNPRPRRMSLCDCECCDSIWLSWRKGVPTWSPWPNFNVLITFSVRPRKQLITQVLFSDTVLIDAIETAAVSGQCYFHAVWCRWPQLSSMLMFLLVAFLSQQIWHLLW